MGPFEEPASVQIGAQDSTMPIAVIGMSFHGPGEANSVESFYNLLVERRETWSKVPEDRWNHDAFYHPDPMRNGTSHVEGGHFLQRDLAAFDARFFNMTAQEAACLDPQQRLLLECCYDALDNGGISLQKARGSNTSVFVGSFATDYTDLLYRDPKNMPTYQATNSGGSRALLSNRLSYFFDFRGPSVTVDTACSASTVAFHLACQSLRSGDAQQAIVGGSSIILSPVSQISMSAMGFLSRDGRCHTFSDKAAGYGRSEGAGCIVLKPLDAAQRDGDCIRAVVRCTSSNQDGKTPGVAFPSQQAQEDVIMRSFIRAGLDPAAVGYHELHGTGTAAGDPIEAAAVHQTMSRLRPNSDPLRIGSVKSNIGHMEGASGIASLVKCILMLEKEVILPSVNHVLPNPRIPMREWNLKFCTELEPWGEAPKRLSICGFGYGGSNAHMILEQASAYSQARGTIPRLSFQSLEARIELPARVFPISASSKEGVLLQAKALGRYLITHERTSWDALAHTLTCRRSRLPWTAAIATDSPSTLSRKLLTNDLPVGRRREPCSLAFVFSGQGAQYAGMSKELIDAFPRFKRSLMDIGALIRGFGADWDVIEELTREDNTSRVNQALYSQLLCSAVQIALVDLLASWNIRPSAVVGHSSGEIAAAYSADMLTMEDAVSAAYFRGVAAQQMTKAPVEGAMMAVGLSSAEIQPTLDALASGKVVVACENSPMSTTCSGDASAITELGHILTSRGIFARKLAVDVAYHSPHVRYVGDDYAAKIPRLSPRAKSSANFFSSVTGKQVAPSDVDAPYWVENMLSRVRFSEALAELFESSSKSALDGQRQPKGIDYVIEIGPHSALALPIQQNLKCSFPDKTRHPLYASALIRGQNAVTTILQLASQLYIAGSRIDMPRVNQTDSLKEPGILVDLPTYQWDHTSRFWAESRLSKAYSRSPGPKFNILGGLDLNFNPVEPRWRNILRISELPWIQDHKVQANIVWPAAGYITMALQACQIEASRRDIVAEQFTIRDMSISQALIIPTDGQAETLFCMRPQSEGTHLTSAVWYEFKVFSVLDSNAWTLHCHGLCKIEDATQANAIDGSAEDVVSVNQAKIAGQIDKRCSMPVDVSDFYKKLYDTGLEYGAAFRNITSLRVGESGDAVSSLTVPLTTTNMIMKHADPVIVHPATLDSSFHPIFAALNASQPAGMRPMVPSFFKSISVSNTESLSKEGHDLQVLASASKTDTRHVDANVLIFDSQGRSEGALAEISGLTLTELPAESGEEEISRSLSVTHYVEWKPHPRLNHKLEDCEDFGLTETASNSLTLDMVQSTLGSHTSGALAELRDLLQSNFSRQMLHSTPFAQHLMSIEAEGFLNPGVRILELGYHVGRISILALGLLCRNQNGSSTFGHYALDRSNETLTESIKAIFPSVKHNIRRLDLSVDKTKEQYDLVLVSGILPHEASHNLPQTLLAKGGRIIRLPSVEVSPAERALFGSLPGWIESCPDIEASDQNTSVLQRSSVINGDSKYIHAKTLKLSNEIIVIGANKVADELVGLLTDQGVHVTRQPLLTRFNAEGKTIVFLAEIDDSILPEPNNGDFELVKSILLHSSVCLWVTRGAFRENPTFGLANGMLRSARSENSGGRLTTLDLDGGNLLPNGDAAAIIVNLLAHEESTSDLPSSDRDVEFREIDGLLHVARVIPDDICNAKLQDLAGTADQVAAEPFKQEAQPLKLAVGTPGLLDDIYYIRDAQMDSSLEPEEVEIEVMASGINFRDVMICMGQIAVEDLGAECSGIVTKVGQQVKDIEVGDRVACVHLGAFANRIRTPAATVQAIPGSMNFATAAALPVIFCTAHYALNHVARLQFGESILIHAASGGLGQAAIELSLQRGAIVYATVGTSEKKQLLMDRYGLPSHNIFYSRNSSFADMVKERTNRRGVDVVLNSVAGEALRLTWHCIAPFGRFLEVGKRDIFVNTYLEMSRFARNVSFSAVDLVGLVRERPVMAGQVWREVMQMIKTGHVRPPTPITEYAFGDLASALKIMRQGKHTGKLVAVRSTSEIVKVRSAKEKKELKFKADASFVIVGGLGGIGLSLAMWLVGHGARNLILLSRRGVVNTEARASLELLHQQGVRVYAPPCDVSDTNAVEQAFMELPAQGLPPVHGLIQAAMVLKDTMLANMTSSDHLEVLKPKVQGTWNLHRALLSHPLDFFVMLSSISGVIGNTGQASYAAANTFLDSFAAYRRSHGLPGSSIDLGVVSDVGHVANNAVVADAMKRQGFEGMSKDMMFRLLECALHDNDHSTHQLITGMGTWTDGVSPPQYRAALFSHFRRASRLTTSTSESHEPLSLRERLRKVSSKDEATDMICLGIIEKTAALSVVAAADISPSNSMSEYGIDSLVAVEMRNWIFREVGVRVPVLDLLSPITFSVLARRIADGHGAL